MSVEGAVLDAMVRVMPEKTAKLLLGSLREEWLTEEAEKNECDHSFWRFVQGEPGVTTRCDDCGEANV